MLGIEPSALLHLKTPAVTANLYGGRELETNFMYTILKLQIV